MLWTDGDFVSTEDLQTIDPEVVDVVNSNQTVLEGAAGIIRRGIENAGNFLENKLIGFESFQPYNAVTATHINAVLNTGGAPTQSRRLALEQIVVTDRNAEYWSVLKHWVAVKVLEAIYLAAMNSASSDRYTEKYNAFKTQALFQRWPELQRSGLPVVSQPLPAPAATMSRDPGSFTVSEVAGSGTLDETYDVAITFVGPLYISQAVKNNQESHPSAIVQLALTSGNVLKVDVTDLTFPSGAIDAADLARSSYAKLEAVGWNVYAGPTGGVLRLQNSSVIPAATKTLTLTGDPSLATSKVGIGQYAQAFVTLQDTIQRG